MRQPIRFGKYTLLDRISVGGMAEVFRATTSSDQIVAIKRILPSVSEDQAFIKMFVQEARIGGQLVHPNICEVYELGRNDGTHFLAMEFIWGKDLFQIAERLRALDQPMPLAMVCGLVARALDGLDYAHRKRDPVGRPLELVHRDCSPHNVLVSYEGEVKVIDFGIAKAKAKAQVAQSGILKGKFAYMSPEQVSGREIDRRSDIFALGTILYECATGERLFLGDTDFSVLEKVRTVDIRPPREVASHVPEALEAVIMKALAKDVAQRYQWCSEMRADLERFDVASTERVAEWMKRLFAHEIAAERHHFDTGEAPAPDDDGADFVVDYASGPEATQRDAPAFLEPEDDGLLVLDDEPGTLD